MCVSECLSERERKNVCACVRERERKRDVCYEVFTLHAHVSFFTLKCFYSALKITSENAERYKNR